MPTCEAKNAQHSSRDFQDGGEIFLAYRKNILFAQSDGDDERSSDKGQCYEADSFRDLTACTQFRISFALNNAVANAVRR